jgi:hypothetical protein
MPEVLFFLRKSNRVFSLLLAICFYHDIIINLGGLYFGTIVGQVQPPPLYWTILCLLVACLLVALLATVSS